MDEESLMLDASITSSTFDAGLPAVLTVNEGARFRVRTRSILSHVDALDADTFAGLGDYSHMDIPVTGPIEVTGALPGDVLRIEILGIDVATHGAMVTLPGRGGFTEPLASAGLILPIIDGEVHFDDVRLPVQPMVGKIGVGDINAPHCSTVGRHGGNMDCTQIGVGATLYLPVITPGAKLFIGDLHARQGDGEASLTGVEVEGTVSMSCHLVRGWPLQRPLLVTADDTITIGDGEDLDEAVRVALDDMLQLVQAARGWDRERAGMFVSAAADVAVCQVVNARKSARVTMAKALLSLAIPPKSKE